MNDWRTELLEWLVIWLLYLARFGQLDLSQMTDQKGSGIIITVPKKGDSSHCSNNRGITLRSKLFQIIILQRLQNGLKDLLRENQCGFRRNRSCIDQIYSLRCIIHNCIDYNLPLYINFVEFKASFVSISRDFIWRAFGHYGIFRCFRHLSVAQLVQLGIMGRFRIGFRWNLGLDRAIFRAPRV